jgi:hypothetical protein
VENEENAQLESAVQDALKYLVDNVLPRYMNPGKYAIAQFLPNVDGTLEVREGEVAFMADDGNSYIIPTDIKTIRGVDKIPSDVYNRWSEAEVINSLKNGLIDPLDTNTFAGTREVPKEVMVESLVKLRAFVDDNRVCTSREFIKNAFDESCTFLGYKEAIIALEFMDQNLVSEIADSGGDTYFQGVATRGDVIKMLYNMFHTRAFLNTDDSMDIQSWIVATGLLTKDETGSYRESDAITYEEFAVVLDRLQNLYKK